MIIKKITIENFLCYYDINEFELSDGLNIVLGENGEGKTKLFEALEWLFKKDTNEDLNLLISAKALDQGDVGEELKVRVSITTEQFNEKQIVSKSFIAKKIADNECETTSLTLQGIEENRVGERTQVDGQVLLDRIFPSDIRRYSMFKGESELDIFKNTDALKILINNFSQSARYYQKYSEKGEYLKEKAQKAVEDSTKQNNKKQTQYNALENEIITLNIQKEKIKVKIDAATEEKRKLKENLNKAKKHVKNSKALDTINARIKKIDKTINETNVLINENYTEALFDHNWILVNFESIQKEFTEKINKLSKERRKLQSDFDKEIGIKEGEKKLKAELLKNAIPLPVTVPSKAVMEEMLEAEICKVCNTEAPKGSPPYEFMTTRLKNYLASQEANEEEEEQDLFEFDYTSRLVTLNTSHEDSLKDLRTIQTEIKELFEFNEKRKEDVTQSEIAREKEMSDRDKIIGDSILEEDELEDVMKNYDNWQEDLMEKNRFLVQEEQVFNDYKTKLADKRQKKDEIDLESANSFELKSRDILRDIETIFTDTKEQKFDEFIQKLQVKSNEFFGRINVESFTGTIVFSTRKSIDKLKIDVDLEEDGRIFFKPNQSLLTSKYISILFAISDLASEVRDDKYPLIFDAPTSSFGENKTSDFLNLIHETGNQKILLLKDYLVTNPTTKTLEIKTEFEKVKRDKAFWIRLERPFNPKNLKTINTEVISL